MNQQDLIKFLLESNKAGYASGEEKKWIKEADGSTSIPFESGNWKLHDNFFGGEPYGGRIIVFYEDKPVWMMVYYGWVIEGIDINEVYKILRLALTNMPEDAPFRGPKKLIEGEFKYTNNWQGDVTRFSGEEQIHQGVKLIYKANYMGGWVDQKRGL